MKTLDNYLRSKRKQSGLTQKDLAHLLGHSSACTVSKLESGKKTPGLQLSICISILFRKSIKSIFPKLYNDCQYLVIKRVDSLLARMGNSDKRNEQVKKNFLENLMNDIVNDNK